MPAPYTVPQLATFVAVSDLNGDHKADLVVISSHTINIMLGNGDGTFQLPISFNPPYAPSALGVGDFNRDGKMDLAMAEQFAGINQVQIFLGNGDGTFQAGVSYPVSSEPSSVAVGDFRADGKLDLAVANTGGNVSVLLGTGNPDPNMFAAPVNYFTSSGSRGVAIGARSYRQVESILRTGLDRAPLPAPAEPAKPVIDHENLRGPNYYN